MSTDDSFRAFVDARWPSLVRFAWTLTGDRAAAEDVVQTALLACWRRWRSVRPDTADAYVRAAVVNTVVSRARRRRVAEVLLRSGDDGGPEPATERDVAHEQTLHEAVRAELLRLPPRMRAVVVLRFLEDLSETETARLLGMSPGAVKTQTSRAVARLRERTPLRLLVEAPAAEGER